MTASDLYKAGKLADAIAAQIQEVKAKAGDQSRRLFLFELAAFAGDLDRAARQIEAVRYTETEREVATVGYRKLLDAERLRRRLFSESLTPKFLSEPPDHVRIRLEAINRLREGRATEASDLLKKANDLVPALKGSLNAKTFEGIRDADDLFGSVLEVMAHGNYYWLPLEQVACLALNAPEFPRDLIWAQARLMMTEGEHGEVFLPVLYPGSHEHVDDQVKLGRSTDWKTLEGGAVLGVGARTFLVGDDASSLPEWRELQINA
jgi:type VI secretion system protein ImpE